MSSRSSPPGGERPDLGLSVISPGEERRVYVFLIKGGDDRLGLSPPGDDRLDTQGYVNRGYTHCMMDITITSVAPYR